MWFVAVAGLILTAAVTAPFFFVTSLRDELAIAAALSLGAAIAAGVLARRFARREADRLTPPVDDRQEALR